MAKKFKGPFMDEDLKTIHLLGIMDVLVEAGDTPLSIHQIQYRLGVRGVTMSKQEIEAHLRWGQNQPNATNAPVKPAQKDVDHPAMRGHGFIFRGWVVVPKVKMTPEEHKAAGSPPWLYKV